MARASRLNDVLQMLRAAAESTRLRLLAVCAQGELTVGELCQILGQSQPRVSRHLKLLCDAGLLVRFREGHCVYYRVPTQGQGADAVHQLLAWMEGGDATLDRDRSKSASVRQRRATLATKALDAEGSEPAELLAKKDKNSLQLREVLLNEATETPQIGDFLDIGTGTGRLLKWLAPKARQAIGVDISADALRVARTAVHGAGLSHCVLQQGDMYELPFPSDSFDLITMDRLLASAQRPSAALHEAARVLRPAGKLVVVEDYDRLEDMASAHRRNALALLREWLKTAGLECERLRPVDTESQHLILATGRRHDGRMNLAA